jgi:hypothetical protein
LNYADSEEEVRQIVKNTVWHEIAHHFGSSEESVRLAETRRRKNNLRRIQNEKPLRNSAGEVSV